MSTRLHGVLDYIVGALIALSPWLFGFAAGDAETWTPFAIGLAGLIYSLMTRYELGLVPLIPMKTHLALDAASGLFLAASPWLFGFQDAVFAPHLAFGLFEFGAAMMTRRTPATAPA